MCPESQLNFGEFDQLKPILGDGCHGPNGFAMVKFHVSALYIFLGWAEV
jgi:hypothetical protein